MMNNFKQSKKEYFEKEFLDTNFSELTIESTIFESCTFDNCDFTDTELLECRFIDCLFDKSNFNMASIKDTSFSYVIFKHSKIIGINWTEAKWPHIKLEFPIKFHHCDIVHSTFLGLYLSEIVMQHCRVKDVDLRETNMSKADLSYSDFLQTLFVNTNLTKVDFSNATNYAINVSVNQISKAKFMLPEAMSLLYGLDIQLINQESNNGY